MAQSWTNFAAATVWATMRDGMSNAVNTLRSMWSGSSDPTDNVAWQTCARTDTKMVRMRDSTNSAYSDWLPTGFNAARGHLMVPIGTLSASGDYFLGWVDKPCNVIAVGLLSDATTAHTAGNEYTFQLRNETAANNLFSSAAGTVTTVGGVGGGNLTANTVRYFTTNQNNATLAASSVFELQITKTGAPANITRLTAILHVELTGV